MQNSEIPLSEVWSISGNWGKHGIPIFGASISNKMLPNVAKWEGYSFYRF